MCGIAGILSGAFTEQQIKVVTDAMHHRGPDAGGYYTNEAKTVFLGHRRLSILDLSTSSNQPFFSASKRFVIVFNGEVYNYRELATKYNLQLSTTSDTEVIVELYEKLGKACVQEFNGMFAFAIYDTLKDETFLCRDRLGVKPLFLYSSEAVIAFASELKAITALPEIRNKLTVDKEAAALFLHLGYIPAPRTIYKQVQKFPTGSYALIKGATITVESYWKPEDKIAAKTVTDFQEAKKTMRHLLETSIAYRMISDVPFGAFLSGGIDSSLVAALAQRHSNVPLKTFSIGFKEAKFDESVHAKKVATYLGTEHEEYILSEQDALHSIEKVMDNFDEPFADASALPTWLVSSMSSQKVKMVLTGDGGDELFMGYGAYNWAQRLANPVLYHSRQLIYAALKSTNNNRNKRAAGLFRFDKNTELKSHIFSQEQYFFSKYEVEDLLLPNTTAFPTSWIEDGKVSRKLSPKENQSLFDLKYYLTDDLLVKVDRASMLSSIEAREPLLDYRIVEYALNLDESLKYNKGVSKVLLKEILYDLVPRDYFNRPKSGFSIPLGKWLKRDLKSLLDKYLSEEAIAETQLMDYKQIQALVKRYLSGEEYLYNRLWVIILLQRWLMRPL